MGMATPLVNDGARLYLSFSSLILSSGHSFVPIIVLQLVYLSLGIVFRGGSCC